MFFSKAEFQAEATTGGVMGNPFVRLHITSPDDDFSFHMDLTPSDAAALKEQLNSESTLEWDTRGGGPGMGMRFKATLSPAQTTRAQTALDGGIEAVNNFWDRDSEGQGGQMQMQTQSLKMPGE